MASIKAGSSVRKSSIKAPSGKGGAALDQSRTRVLSPAPNPHGHRPLKPKVRAASITGRPGSGGYGAA